MAAQLLLDEIVWDGQAIQVEAATENGRVICRVRRETIHSCALIRMRSAARFNSSATISSRGLPHF